MLEQEHQHKYRKQNGETPGIKAFHEVYITKDLGSTKNEEITAFINENITAAKGIPKKNTASRLCFSIVIRMPRSSSMNSVTNSKFQRNILLLKRRNLHADHNAV